MLGKQVLVVVEISFFVTNPTSAHLFLRALSTGSHFMKLNRIIIISFLLLIRMLEETNSKLLNVEQEKIVSNPVPLASKTAQEAFLANFNNTFFWQTSGRLAYAWFLNVLLENGWISTYRTEKSYAEFTSTWKKAEVVLRVDAGGDCCTTGVVDYKDDYHYRWSVSMKRVEYKTPTESFQAEEDFTPWIDAFVAFAKQEKF